MIVCVHEDRANYITGLKLTVLSLVRHCPNLPVIISYPHPSASFREWVETLPNIQLIADPDLAGLGWNVKPSVLLRCLDEGHPEVIWIDSDILVTRDFRQRLSHLDDETLVVTQNSYWDLTPSGTYATVAWGLKPGRSLPITVNTGIVRVTLQHTELLKTWQTMLSDQAYIDAQQKPWYERPRHLVGDQDVLTAILGATEFSHIPIKMLERGIDIAQCIGPSDYTPTERLRNLQSLPTFVHGMGYKPWLRPMSPELIWSSEASLPKRLRQYYDYVHVELSPYISIAHEYQEQLGEEASWMDAKSAVARLLVALFAGHPTLQEFPLALFEASIRHTRTLAGLKRLGS